MVAGWQAKLRINGAVFAFARANVRSRVDNQRVTNSEGFGAPVAAPGFHTSINGNAVLEADVDQAAFDPAANPFLAPPNLFEGAYVTFSLFPSGVGGVSWQCSSFHVLEVSQATDVNALSPVRFAGESNGFWQNPIA
jgi:hypothetical protein